MKLKISDIKPDEENPRYITEESKAQLNKSITKFNNIEGIVWNSRTRTLISGHQRFNELKEIYKDLSLRATKTDEWWEFVHKKDQPTGFRLRVVDWDEEKQKAANIVANSPLNQGSWDLERLEGIMEAYDLKEFREEFKLEELKNVVTLEKMDTTGRDLSRGDDGGDDDSDMTEIRLKCHYDIANEVVEDVRGLVTDKYDGQVDIKI